MSELRCYPDYKDSGVPWLGEIPSHWDEKRMRFFINTNPLKSELDVADDTMVSFLPMEALNIGGGMNLETDKEISEVYKGYTYFRNEDVVIAKITPCFENGKASISENLTNGIGFGTTELHVLRPKDGAISKFIFYLIRSDSFMKIGESEMYGAGGQKRIPESFIKNFLGALPPLDEQQAIVNFLDTELEHIDTLISRQQQLIEKLAEQRSAVITHAVTKGLDLDVPMKDSGIEWLGDMPEHWKATKLKYYFDIQLGKMLQPNPSLSDDFEVNYLKAMHVQWDDTKVIDLPKMWCNERELEKYQVYDGDLLVCEGGEVGRSALIRGLEGTTIIQNALHRLRSTDAGDVRYLNYVIRHIADSEWFSILCNKATIAHLTGDKLANTFITLPPLSEQLDIIDHLDSQTKKIDEMSDSNKSIIAKLQEYRSALITQAVTGKIDVRHINKKAS